jgi:hypothetical protein
MQVVISGGQKYILSICCLFVGNSTNIDHGELYAKLYLIGLEHGHYRGLIILTPIPLKFLFLLASV